MHHPLIRQEFCGWKKKHLIKEVAPFLIPSHRRVLTTALSPKACPMKQAAEFTLHSETGTDAELVLTPLQTYKQKKRARSEQGGLHCMTILLLGLRHISLCDVTPNGFSSSSLAQQRRVKLVLCGCHWGTPAYLQPDLFEITHWVFAFAS